MRVYSRGKAKSVGLEEINLNRAVGDSETKVCLIAGPLNPRPSNPALGHPPEGCLLAHRGKDVGG